MDDVEGELLKSNEELALGTRMGFM